MFRLNCAFPGGCHVTVPCLSVTWEAQSEHWCRFAKMFFDVSVI